MKLSVFAIFLLPLTAAAQSNREYNKTMATFQKFYNAGQGDSINTLFNYSLEKMKAIGAVWTKEKTAGLITELGTMKSFRYIGVDTSDPEKVHVYETFFSKAGKKMTSLTLHENRRIGTFRLITIPDDMNALQKKYKSRQ